MTQTSMFAQEELVKARKRRVAQVRRDAIAEFGGGEQFAAAVGVGESAVSMALNDRADRPWREEWTVALLDSPSVKPATKRAIADALLGGSGLVSAPQEEVSVRDVAERALAALERFGSMGQPVADELRGLLLSALAAGRYK